MTKTLKQFLEVYKPKSPDEQKFVDKHVTIKHKDRNGNNDDVFTASNVKAVERKGENHGYDSGEDEKVYEAADIDPGLEDELMSQRAGKSGDAYRAKKKLVGNQHKLDHNKNGKVDAHDFHLMRNKKKVAEEAEELDESAKIAAHLIKRYGDNVRKSHVLSAANDFGVDASKLAKAVRAKLSVDSLKEAPSGAKYERMVENGYAKGGLSDRERAMAYATAWKAKKANEGVEYTYDEPTMEDIFDSKTEGLTEASANLLYGIFAALSEENQIHFLESLDTTDGINAMLDFAIENRGE